jgi:hypothetical protein
MALGISLRLAKAGWWQGDPGAIMRAPADEVMAAYQYDNFVADYERAVFDLNKEQRN